MVKRAKKKDDIRNEAIEMFIGELDVKLRRMRPGMVLEMYVKVEVKDPSSLRETKEYRDWRKSVLERDNNKCVDCGTNENLHAHHEIPFQYDPLEQGINVDNGVTLCGKCHRKRHQKRK